MDGKLTSLRVRTAVRNETVLLTHVNCWLDVASGSVNADE